MRFRLNVNGFTLVELLVTIVIGGIVLTAVYEIFISQYRAYMIQSQVSEMQQNGRIALLIISRDARIARYNSRVDGGLGIPKNWAVHGFNNTASSTITDPFAQDTVDIADDVKTGTDAIWIVYQDDNTPDYLVIPPGASFTANNFSFCCPDNLLINGVDEDPFPYDDGQLLCLIGCGGIGFIEVTQLGTTGGSCPAGETMVKINFAPGQSAQNYPSGIDELFPEPIYIGSAVSRIYYVNTSNELRIATPTTGGFSSDPLADNIEDMQFAYGLDTDADDLINTWTNDPAGSEDEIRAIRINVLARTRREDRRNRTFFKDAVEDGSRHPAAGTDGFRRRLFSSEVQVRNMYLP
ncbi:MAG: PilW family protein [Thermodesulfobacteriota bacterium]|nr:PilW family protein [Thermodesulfobacteriota bacterium]